MENMEIPKEVSAITKALEEEGHEAYLVGGCVRDILLGRTPKDWDVATSARPEEIQKIFPDSIYENTFGTVGVKTDSEDISLRLVEVTTFRIEGKYTDKRHPDEIKFADTIEEDLSRRDFTVNAMALALTKNKKLKTSARGGSSSGGKNEIVDPYEGKKDLEDQVIRTVGEPDERFGEDALRIMRAVRFASELGFKIEPDTRKSMEHLAGELELIANERIRDEFIKILMTRDAARGVIELEKLGLLEHVLPELREGVGVEQNLHHIYTVFEHCVRSLDYSAKQDHPLHIRLASLLHDVGKPKTKTGEGRNSHFYGHEVVGAKMAVRALDRLKFPKDFTEKVAHLVRYHMFYYNVGELTEAGVRRFIQRVGQENIDDLIMVREADRIGSGVPKAVPYKLRHLRFMIDKVSRDPISPKMLKVSGDDIMNILKLEPSPKVGAVLSALMEEVIENPEKNEQEKLEKRVKELGKLSDKELKKLAEKGREKVEEFESGVESDIKDKHHVK